MAMGYPYCRFCKYHHQPPECTVVVLPESVRAFLPTGWELVRRNHA